MPYIKTKLQCGPSEPTKAHITAKEFVILFSVYWSSAGICDGKDKHFS